MVPCPSCQTLNPDGESRCLACQAPLSGDRGYGTSRTKVERTGESATARCPNGHPINPSWTACPYCDRGSGLGTPARLEEEAGGRKAGGDVLRATRLEQTGVASNRNAGIRVTRLADEPGEPGSPSISKSRRAAERTTRLEAPSRDASSEVRKSELHPSDDAGRGRVASEAKVSAASSSRRLVGVLAAPDLRPGGAVFAVREGKNRIGADPASEILLDLDPQVSAEHALLLSRNGAFHLADRMSTNGTAINGEELVGTHATPLSDRDHIRCGATELVLFVLAGESASVENVVDSPSSSARTADLD